MVVGIACGGKRLECRLTDAAADRTDDAPARAQPQRRKAPSSASSQTQHKREIDILKSCGVFAICSILFFASKISVDDREVAALAVLIFLCSVIQSPGGLS